jgi:indolepyruvate ferredoxin oxidoreductase
VVSYVRLSDNLDDLHNGHITAGGTDLLIACDIVSAVGRAAHETLNPERTVAVVNIDNTPVAAFVLNNKIDFKNEDLQKDLTAATKKQYFVDATSAVGNLLGDEMGTNIFMMGYAWQKGLLPLGEDSLMHAIELNGVSIDDNKEAFMYGRLAAHDHVKMEQIIAANKGPDLNGPISVTLEEVISKRIETLKKYQNKAYAMRYKAMVERFRDYPNLQDAVARNYFKLMAYKDEYEVARLYTNGDFIKTVRAQFDGDYKLKFNLAPPIFETEDPATGRPKKRVFGPWMMPALSILKHFKFLRGSAFDPFGRLKDRVEERALIREYEDLMDDALTYYSAENAALCEELLRTPDEMRGYGPVKAGNIGKARQKQRRLLDQISSNKSNMLKAA